MPDDPAPTVPQPLDIAAATAALRAQIVARLAVVDAERAELIARLRRLDGPRPRKPHGTPPAAPDVPTAAETPVSGATGTLGPGIGTPSPSGDPIRVGPPYPGDDDTPRPMTEERRAELDAEIAKVMPHPSTAQRRDRQPDRHR